VHKLCGWELQQNERRCAMLKLHTGPVLSGCGECVHKLRFWDFCRFFWRFSMHPLRNWSVHRRQRLRELQSVRRRHVLAWHHGGMRELRCRGVLALIWRNELRCLSGRQLLSRDRQRLHELRRRHLQGLGRRHGVRGMLRRSLLEHWVPKLHELCGQHVLGGRGWHVHPLLCGLEIRCSRKLLRSRALRCG